MKKRTIILLMIGAVLTTMSCSKQSLTPKICRCRDQFGGEQGEYPQITKESDCEAQKNTFGTPANITCKLENP